MVKIGETVCKSALNRSGIEGIDFAINPYIGCAHGCVYCYARFMTRWYHKGEKWGSFVDVKKDITDILKKELKKKHNGIVLLSSVTDPYQPIEKKMRITRNLLEILADHGFQVEVLTKSFLVTRDIDIFNKIDMCEVGLSITMWNDNVRRVFEPNTSSIRKRLNALKILSDEGINTYAFLGPLLPFLSEENLEDLMDILADRADRIIVDRLNLKAGNWGNIKKTIEDNYPDMLDRFKLASAKESVYYSKLSAKVRSLLSERLIPSDVLF
jgi:DNA repair photolyase